MKISRYDPKKSKDPNWDKEFWFLILLLNIYF